MLRIRLRRVGKKKQPMYRIVVADSRSPRDGAFVESLGYYHPMDNPSTIVLNPERAKHWLEHGAQPSERVWKILAIQGLAELPAKLKTRIALGEQRAKDAAEQKAQAKVEEEAESKPEAPAPVAAAESPAAESPAAGPAEEAPAAEAAVEEPPAEASAEPAAEPEASEPAAAETEEETPGA